MKKKPTKLNLLKVPGVRKINPTRALLNSEQTGLAILECLENLDPQGAFEVFNIYLQAVSKNPPPP